MTMSVDAAIADLYPEAELFSPSASNECSNDKWVSPARFQPIFQPELPQMAFEFEAEKPKEIQAFSFPMQQDEIWECPMGMMGDFSACMNTWTETTQTSFGEHTNLDQVCAWDCTEEAVAEEAAQNSDAATPRQECRSTSSHSDDGSDGKGGKRPMRPWTKDEHAKFLTAIERLRTTKTEKVKKNGKQTSGLGPGVAEVIALILQTRDAAQVRSHAQKHFQRVFCA